MTQEEQNNILERIFEEMKNGHKTQADGFAEMRRIFKEEFKKEAGGSSFYDVDGYYGGDYELNDKISKIQKLNKQLQDLRDRIQELIDDGIENHQEEIDELRDIYSKLEQQRNKYAAEVNKHPFDAKLDNHINKLTKAGNRLDNIIYSIQRMGSEIDKLANPWAQADKAASKYAKTIATSKAGYEALRANTIKNVAKNHLGIKYNLSTEEIIAAQEEYNVGTGRNIRLSNEAQATLGTINKVYGSAGKELSVMYEKFGLGAIDSGKKLGKMYAEAAKSGVSLAKYTENVKTGLALAQKFTFANGLKGMEAMAKRAAAIHLDMAQIETLANKVGTIEGAITTSAKIQVLGGQFSALADPMGMFSEAWGDFEGLEKRMEKFTENMAHFNRATGEVTMSAFNRQQLRAFADASGQDYQKVLEQAMQQGKRKEIDAQIKRNANASGLNDEMKELIRNSATFKDGKAVVSIRGKDKSLDELKNGDYEDLINETKSEKEDIKDIANMLRDYFDVKEGFKKQRESLMARFFERFGIGKAIKGFITGIGMTNILLTILNGILITKGILNIAGSGMNLAGRRGLNFGRVFNGKAASGGKVANTIKGAGTSTAAGKAATGGIRGRLSNLFGKKTITSSTGKVYTKVNGKLYNEAGKRVSGAAEKAVLDSQKKGVGRLFSKVKKPITPEIPKKPFTKLGRFGADSITRVDKIGQTLSKKGYTKAGGLISKHAEKQALKHGLKGIAKKGGQKIAVKTASKIGGKMLAGVAKGGVAGIVGAAGNIATDMLVDSGKIKKGGTAHTAMKVGSSALEGAALGATIGSIFPGIGTAIGGAIGAIGGAVVGAVKMTKIKREQALDNKLAEKGIERKGNYGAARLKKIDKGLQGKKISNRLRRKMEREGDFELLAEIDKAQDIKKKEKAEKKEARKQYRLEKIKARHDEGENKLKMAHFDVGIAHFGGKAFGVGEIGPRIKAKNVLKPALGIGKKIIGKKSGLISEGIKVLRGKPEDGNSSSLTLLRNMSKRGQQGADGIGKSTKIEPIDINISGTLKLDGGNGKSVDIIDEIKHNKQLLQQIVNMLTEPIVKEINNKADWGNKVVRSNGIKLSQNA